MVELWVSVSGAVDDGNYGPEKWPGEFIEQKALNADILPLVQEVKVANFWSLKIPLGKKHRVLAVVQIPGEYLLLASEHRVLVQKDIFPDVANFRLLW